MTTFGIIESAKRKAHVTIAQANAEMEEYLQHANRLIITRIKLLNSGVVAITSDELKRNLDEHAEDIAANKWHMENDSDRPHKGYELAIQQMKDTVKAEYSKQVDGISHNTFGKTVNKITSDTLRNS